MKREQGEGSGERPTPTPKESIVEESPRNISGRILDSASGLLRDSLSPKSSQHPNTLAQVLCSEGKAGPSTPSASTERSNASGILEGPSHLHSAGSFTHTRDAFRESCLLNERTGAGSGDTTKGLSLDEFMQSAQHESEVPTWQHSASAKGKQVATTSDGYHPQHEVTDADISAVWDSVTPTETSTGFSGFEYVDRPSQDRVRRAAEISAADGADVVKLLQDPNAWSWMDVPDEPEPPYTISADDMRIAQEVVHRIDKALASNPGYQSAISAARRGESFSNFSSFFDDIKDYQEEVWGYLQPIIEEARRETIPRSSGEKEGPATRRLRMILAHIDRSG